MTTSGPSGHLDLLLLAVLAEGELHGYAVVTELRRRSNGHFDLPEGTVYPALHKLEGKGLLSSRWDHASGRRRRAYSTTAAGRAALGERAGEWRAFSRGVQAVLGGAL